MRSNLHGWDDRLATLFGIGLSPVAPGTLGSAAGVVLYAALASWLGLWFWLALIATLFFFGTLAADRVARRWGKDPQRVVVDELVGQLIALQAARFYWVDLLLAFALFRAFDILKPPPIRQAERLPGGLGIMADDVLAGLLALLVLALLRLSGVLG